MHHRPLLLPAVALGCGIAAAGILPLDGWGCAATALLCLELARRTGWSALLGAGWALLGAAALALSAPPGPGQHPLDSLSSGEPLLVRGTVCGPPLLQPDGSWEAQVDLEAPVRGRIRLFGETSPPPPGSLVSARVRLSATRSTHLPGQSHRAARQRRAGEGWCARPTPRDAVLAVPGARGPLVRVRRAVRRFLSSRLEPPVDGLALALVLGERSTLDPDLRDLFARTGTAHLLAISGLHVGIVALTLAALVRGAVVRWPGLRRHVPPRSAALVAGLAAALAYGTLTGWSISTRRAAAMVAVVAVALLSRRRVDPIQLLAAAWCALLLADPTALWEPATALSFSSVGALVRLTPPRLRHPAISTAVATAAVTLGTAPFNLAFFGRVALLALPANALAIPVLGMVLVPLLLASVAVGLVWPGGGTALLAVADTVARGGCSALEFIGDPRWCVGLERAPPPGLLAASAILLAGALALPRLRYRWPAAIAATAIALLPIHPAAPRPGTLALTVFSVGHGDAMLVSLPTGEQLLVDAGGSTGEFDPGARLVVPALRRMGVHHLDAVVVSHLHHDHYGGIPAVLQELQVDGLWVPVTVPDDHPAAAATVAARDAGVPIHTVVHGDALPTTVGPVRIETRHPLPGRPCPGHHQDCTANSHSMVLRLTYGSVSFLLTGDAEADLEEMLLAQEDPLQADVIKIPHHASDTSSSAAFLDAVSPRLGVASLDPLNRHAFPRPSVRRRYGQNGATFLATGIHGTVQVSTDGRDLEVRTFTLPWGWRRH